MGMQIPVGGRRTAVLPVGMPPASGGGPVQANPLTFSTAGIYAVFVPAGVTSMTFRLWGAGGQGQDGTDTNGGGAGFAKLTVATTPLEMLTVIVGSAMNQGSPGTGPGNNGAWGGGFSGVFRGATILGIAGGGGGAGRGTATNGGVGGGATGGAGVAGSGGAGGGGTQSAGGAAGAANSTAGPGKSGSVMKGGDGGPVDTSTTANLNDTASPSANHYPTFWVGGGGAPGRSRGGGGGGGGYYGGGGGGGSAAAECGGGGGGSNGPTASLTTDTQGSGRNPGGTGEALYNGTAGVGGNSYLTQPTPGQVTVTW